MAKGNKPEAKYRVGYVTATVWLNDGVGDRKFYNVVLSKSYKDDKEKWQETDQLGHADVVCAIKALERAESYIGSQDK